MVGLNFGEHEDVVFKKAPLVSVLCQIRFPPVLSLMTRAGVTGFQVGIRDQYPQMLPVEQQATVQVGPRGLGIEANPPVWRFRDSSDSWTVGLAVDFVSLETTSYTDVDEFLRRLRRVLKILRLTIRPADSVRVGFRKINRIRMPLSTQTASLVGLIRKELLGVLSVQQFPAMIATQQGLIQFQDDTNFLTVRHGLASDDEGPSFTMDLDYFTERPYRVDEDEELIGFMRYLSEGMTSFFHWAIEEDYKSKLEPTRRIRGTT